MRFLADHRDYRSNIKVPIRDTIEQELSSLEAFGGRLLCATDADFPPLLKQLAPPPPVLSARGRLSSASPRTIAIVGARQASALGRKLARDLARDLSAAGYVIVSGLARGIDGEAHAASVETGTIAVLGGGVDHVYPPQHKQLYDAIADQGLILSESPLGYRATARDFPRRNRIVTGLSQGVIVIEAAERSGSLISARTAAEQNRDVFAVPGSPLDPRYAGSNRLLRDGAILVRHADDVIDALATTNFMNTKAPTPPSFDIEDTPPEDMPVSQMEAVLDVLTVAPVQIEDIARAAAIGVHRCAAILVELELQGVVTTYPGGMASLTIT